jgi:chaperonin GroES
MRNLEGRITLTDAVCRATNLTDRFSAEDLHLIGNACKRGYEADEASRADWLRRTQAAMQLALQITKAKTFPWPNCSNIAFPLLTIAVLQFHSRAYPALFAGPDIVKYRVPGPDPTGVNTDHAQRVSRFMSYQALEEDQAFEEQHDRLLINVPIVGCAFVKTRYSSAAGHSLSEFIPAHDLVIDYYAKSVESAARKTQITPLSRNEVYERCVSGVFCDILEDEWYKVPFQPETSQASLERDRIAGVTRGEADESTPIFFCEQHCWLDLDGDGYAEPYIVTFEPQSGCVVRIVARWERPEDIERVTAKGGTRILRIHATEYYTKYGLIPAPDGSIYDIGFGVLLGPLNESTNTLVNQLTDAGTMATTAGGFLSRGVKIKGGVVSFSPFGWNTVESTGDDLRKGIFPLPVREPSNVLFQLLTLIINYTQRISGSTDATVGENPGQNTPKGNLDTMVEQGLKIYGAIFKRLWRSMRDEFRKRWALNAVYLPDSVRFGDGQIGREDFLESPSNLCPAADPTMVSDSMKVQQAVAIKQAAATTPGYNLAVVEKNFLTALHVDGIEQLYPGPDKVPPLKNPKVQVEELKLQAMQARIQADQKQHMLDLAEEHQLNAAKIVQLEALAAKAMAEANGVAAGHQIAAFEAALGALKHHNDGINKRLELMLKEASDENIPGNGGRVVPPPGHSGLPGASQGGSAGPDGAMGAGPIQQ